MKTLPKLIRITVFAIFATCVMQSCGDGTSTKTKGTAEKIQGEWEIQTAPPWVKKNYLSWRSNTWTFLPDGICSLGKATGVYNVEDSGRVKIMLSMQEATPGFTGLFEPTFSGDTLTMKNLTEEEPIILKNAGN